MNSFTNMQNYEQGEPWQGTSARFARLGRSAGRDKSRDQNKYFSRSSRNRQLKNQIVQIRKGQLWKKIRILGIFPALFQNLTMKMTEFFDFVNGFGFPDLCLIFWSEIGQLWNKIRILGIFPALFQIFGVKMEDSFVCLFRFGFSDFLLFLSPGQDKIQGLYFFGKIDKKL